MGIGVKVFKIKEALQLGTLNRDKKPKQILIYKDGKVGYSNMDTAPKQGSGNLMTSGDIYNAIKYLTSSTGSVIGGGSASLQNLQGVTTIGNTTNRGLILRNSAGDKEYLLEVDTNGHLVFTGGLNQNAHFSGDVTAYSAASPPPASWWDDIPVDGTSIQLNGSGELEVIGVGGGNFDDLSDTPSSKAGSGLKAIRVNSGETALEYFDVQSPLSGGSGIEINGTSIDLNGDLTGTTKVSLPDGNAENNLLFFANGIYLQYYDNVASKNGAIWADSNFAMMQTLGPSSKAANIYVDYLGYAITGDNNFGTFKGFKYKNARSVSNIDWTTDANKGLLIPSQDRVDAIITADTTLQKVTDRGAVTTNTITAPRYIGSELDNTSIPTANDAFFDGYGIKGNRTELYVTNYNATGKIIFGNNGHHNVNANMTILGGGEVLIGATSQQSSEQLLVDGGDIRCTGDIIAYAT